MTTAGIARRVTVLEAAVSTLNAGPPDDFLATRYFAYRGLRVARANGETGYVAELEAFCREVDDLRQKSGIDDIGSAILFGSIEHVYLSMTPEGRRGGNRDRDVACLLSWAYYWRDVELNGDEFAQTHRRDPDEFLPEIARRRETGTIIERIEKELNQ